MEACRVKVIDASRALRTAMGAEDRSGLTLATVKVSEAVTQLEFVERELAALRKGKP